MNEQINKILINGVNRRVSQAGPASLGRMRLRQQENSGRPTMTAEIGRKKFSKRKQYKCH